MKTHPKVLTACAKALRALDESAFHSRADDDQVDIQTARMVLLSVLERNGKEIDRDTYRVRKVKP